MEDLIRGRIRGKVTKLYPPEIAAAAARVRVILMDCDGVLTDGRLYYSNSGEELKAFDVRDGYGIATWVKAGFHAGIISGRSSPMVERRAAELGIEHVRQGVSDKLSAAQLILGSMELTTAEASYIGDDIPDNELLRAVGFGVAVADAAVETRSVAAFVTENNGGRGAVREVIDLILSAKQNGR